MPTNTHPADSSPIRQGISPLGIFLLILGGLLILLIIAGFFAPMVVRSRMNAELVTTINNARMIGMALKEFDAEYGRFPDAKTALDVAARTHSNIAPAGTTANDHLRQLIATEIINSEQIFYAQTAFARQPDNRFDSVQTALAPGELGFGYVLNGDTAFGTSGSNPGIPILCAPLAYDGKSVSSSHFDHAQFHGLAVLLRIDMSAVSHRIDTNTGDVMILGKPWLVTGGDTVWGSEIIPSVTTPHPR